MVTPDEIAGVSIFAGLDQIERERLSRVAADIRLVPGEYAVHAGEERALFAVLEGRMETVDAHRRDRARRRRPRRGRSLRGGADRARDGLPVRVSRGGAVAGDAGRGSRLPRDRARRARRRGSSSVCWRGSGSAGCRASRRIRLRHARSWSGIAGMRPARSCDAFSTATRSRSGGSRPTRRMRPTSGAAPCRRRRTVRRFGSSTGRRWCDRSSAGWPSCWGSPPRPSPRSTTR